MSYLDPQSWTDVDSAGNPLDWSSRSQKLLYPGYEMLRKALVERCTVSSTGVPASLQIARASGKIYSGTWFSDFQSTISALIPKFVNSDDSGGDWSGETLVDFAPFWNESDIITAIGDVSRLPAPSIFKSDWSLQQYKILNKLVWARRTTTTMSVFDDRKIQRTKGWPPGTEYTLEQLWNQLDSDWSASWVSPAGVTGNSMGAGGYGVWARHNVTSVEFKEVGGSGVHAGFIAERRYQESPDGSFNVGIDWYAETGEPVPHAGFTPKPTPPYVVTKEFDDEGLGWSAVGTMTKFQTSGSTAIRPVITNYFMSGALPPKPSFWPSYQGQVVRGWSFNSGTIRAVLKWNVTDGFKFV